MNSDQRSSLWFEDPETGEERDDDPLLPWLTNRMIRGLGDSYDDGRIETLIAAYCDLRRKYQEEVFRSLPGEHPEARCHRCYLGNRSWTAPSPLWNYVMRGDDMGAAERFDGIVCATCFMMMAEELGAGELWLVYPQRIGVPLKMTTPDGREWDPVTWMWRKP